MTIQTGEKLPEGTLAESPDFDAETGCALPPQSQDVATACQNKKIVIFGVPGAFTPLCSAEHLPGYIRLAEQIKDAGVDEIWCMAVNDAFVMAAWGKHHQVNGQIRMMADGSADFTRALGLDRDLTAAGMGTRCYRFAMIVDNGVVSYIGVEGSGEFGVSKAETVLEILQRSV